MSFECFACVQEWCTYIWQTLITKEQMINPPCPRTSDAWWDEKWWCTGTMLHLEVQWIQHCMLSGGICLCSFAKKQHGFFQCHALLFFLKELRLFPVFFCSSFFLLSTEGHVNTSIDTRNQLDDCDLIVGKFTKKPSTPSTSVMFLLSQDPQMKQFTFGWVDHGHCGQQGKKFQGHGWKSHQDFDAAVMKEGKMCFLFRGWKVGEGWAGATCHWHLLLSDGHRWC